MKIFKFYSSIVGTSGGGERVFCEMANALAARGHEVFAVCHDYRSGLPFYPLDERVQLINLDGSGHRPSKSLVWKISQPLRLVARKMWDQYVGDPFDEKKRLAVGKPLVRLIQEIQPDIVIPHFILEYHSMIRQPLLNVPVIGMHHSNVDMFEQYSNTPDKIAKNNTCPYLQVLHHSFVPGIQQFYHGSIHVIPNTVPQVDTRDMADLKGEKSQRTIVMVSRLEHAKQQHMLIQAFGHLAKKYGEWNVEIYGQPNTQTYFLQLQSMIRALGLSGRVKLMGATTHPLEVLRQSDIFAFPSNYPEGWGLALTEAMAVGLPCVGLKNTSSVNELIVDGINGLLAENTPNDFAQKLQMLMDDQHLRVNMGQSGYEMMKQYAPEKVWDTWEELIEKVVRQHRQRQAA